MNTTLTVLEAYQAMYAYLDRYYQLTHADEIGAMLGGMSTLQDGGTADPAVWKDWLLSVQQVKNANVETQLRLDDQQ
ncbi:hypothetical protein [Rubinisphaera brasiliensis]|uniref:Uncharacterized protein n=1 Tax=Rubinisphaera brasiliensis (strain ATCC 49424 / DSM 5305 / JCM 21570 / IAM 15109 / NBRC 103401 / IFAM 1448) TaxID=756272 RepID=F0SQD6_RUBBR|nr:hypothetical protein [Rubinisphaera brasiliensis]ADY62315.1 hypothetical protein Plabr_4744 [Rubinisphaera brasiliensis DSM 5305]